MKRAKKERPEKVTSDEEDEAREEWAPGQEPVIPHTFPRLNQTAKGFQEAADILSLACPTCRASGRVYGARKARKSRWYCGACGGTGIDLVHCPKGQREALANEVRARGFTRIADWMEEPDDKGFPVEHPRRHVVGRGD